MAKNMAQATATKVVIEAGHGRRLTPDEIREAFTRVDGTVILDYAVWVKGIVGPRITKIELTVAMAQDAVGE